MKKLLLIVLTFMSGLSFAQRDSIRIANYNLEDRVAVQGYDPVGYFTKGKAIKGKKDLAATYQGVIYQFSSNENKEIFLKDPSKYEPQYGGWCAYAIGHFDEKVGVNPKTFKIMNGKLYLFYNLNLHNTLKSWNKNETALKSIADINWKKQTNE